jgi:hypothetical protein
MADTDKDGDKEGSFNLRPMGVTLDRNMKALMGRLSYQKPLGKDSSLEAYADMMAGKPTGGSAFVKPQAVGLRYNMTFAKGGKTASRRADGIAKRGKTKGRMV